MRNGLVLLTILTLAGPAAADKLVFTSTFGGGFSNGALVGYDLDSAQLAPLVSLAGSPMAGNMISLQAAGVGGDYVGGLTLGQDGMYYGTNSLAAGLDNLETYIKSTASGIFYRVDPATGDLEVLHSFVGDGPTDLFRNLSAPNYGGDLSFPIYKPTETAPGVFYGLALRGGTADKGGVWRFDVNTGEYGVVASFDPAGLGIDPTCPLIAGDGTNLYGVTRSRGGGYEGYLYRVPTDGSAAAFVSGLSGTLVMNHPRGDIAYHRGENAIYGTKDLREINGNWGGGIWKYDLDDHAVTTLWQVAFADLDVLGSKVAGLVRANDGRFYATTTDQGGHGAGTILQYANGTAVKVFDFPAAWGNSGIRASGSGLTVVGTKIYGTTSISYDGPLVWSFDYVTNTFLEVVQTSDLPGGIGNDGEYAIIVADGHVIGRTRHAAIGGAGSVWDHDLSSGETVVLHDASAEMGRSFTGELTFLSADVVVGWSAMGGRISTIDPTRPNEDGELLRIDLGTGAIDIMETTYSHLDNEAVTYSWARPLLTSAGELAYYVDRESLNPFFRLEYLDVVGNANSAYTPLRDVQNTQAGVIPGSVEAPGGRILTAYADTLLVQDATTHAFVDGTFLFVRDVAGRADGNLLLASNGRVYGLTQAEDDVPTSCCALWSVGPATLDVAVEHLFDAGVRSVNFGLGELDGKLYGATNYGGANGDGYLFAYDLTNLTLSVVHDFDSPAEGAGFEAGWTPHDGRLYSTAYTGGAHGNGTLVAFDPGTGSLTVLADLTTETGRPFRATPVVWAPLPLQLDAAVHQNPALTRYADLHVTSNTALTGAPDVALVVGADTTAVAMTALSVSTWSGAIAFTVEGTYTIATRGIAANGTTADGARTFTAGQAKAGQAFRLTAADGGAALDLADGSAVAGRWFTIQDDAGTVHFGPDGQLPAAVDLVFAGGSRELAVYRRDGDGWVAEPTLLGADGTTLTIVTDRLGTFRLAPGVPGETPPAGRNVLHGAAPNPFNPATTVSFDLAVAGEVELAIYAVDGTKVRTLATGRRDAGPYRILWDGRDDGDRRVASGTYFARLRTAQGNLVAKMVLLK
ncbi:hypothetical protein KDM41_08965 [bacterium]|nr:hypothetical protein [bacterium]